MYEDNIQYRNINIIFYTLNTQLSLIILYFLTYKTYPIFTGERQISMLSDSKETPEGLGEYWGET